MPFLTFEVSFCEHRVVGHYEGWALEGGHFGVQQRFSRVGVFVQHDHHLSGSCVREGRGTGTGKEEEEGKRKGKEKETGKEKGE